MSGERVRAFMALLLPPELMAAARRVQEQMRPLFPPGSVRWVTEENFHLTLRFFGNLDRKPLEKASEIVRGLDQGFSAVTVRIAGASAFPSLTRPQTLWVAIGDAAGEIDTLVSMIDRRIREAGFGPEDKPWKSHLTVGRVARDRTVRMDPAWTAGLTWDAGLFTITTVALMQSELRPQGPRYTPLRIASASP
jgi:2'-5' RNA ligase